MLGRYELQRVLGEGGMGTVYRAVHQSLKRTVALKVLRQQYCQNPRFVQRFRREMEAVGRLGHAHVVRATDAGEEGGVLFLVMDYEEGATLNRIVAKHGPLRTADACELVRQAALGLEYIRGQHLVHRDIKPSNLLLTTAGVVKILDLGLARLRNTDEEGPTQSGAVLGTIDYIAPEQVDDAREVDIRADIYSLGCTLYKLIVGCAPFTGEAYVSTAQKLHAHLSIAIQRPTLPAIDDELWAIIAKMTAKDPAERFENPQEVANALFPLAHGADVAALGEASWADESLASMWTGTSSTLGAVAGTSSTAPRETASPPSPSVEGRKTSSRRRTAAMLGVIALFVGTAIVVAMIWNGGAETGSDTSPAEKPQVVQLLAGENNAAPYEPVLLDGQPLLAWQNLFTQPPKILEWQPDDGFSEWEFAPQAEQLEVRTRERAMFALARVEKANFIFQIGMSKPRWGGGSGLFFGYHNVSPETDKDLWPNETVRFQYLSFDEVRGPDGEMTMCIARGVARVTQDPGMPLRVSSRTFAHQQINPPLGEKILEVKVVAGKVRQVRLDGNDLPKLTVDAVDARVVDADHFGYLGTLTVVDECVFRNARAMVHAGE